MEQCLSRLNSSRIITCSDDEKKIIGSIKKAREHQTVMWSYKIDEILKNNDLSVKELAKMCQERPEKIFMWTQGELPLGRTPILKVGMSFCCNIKDLNSFIIKYGWSYPINQTSCDDCICQFVMSKQEGKNSYEQFEQVKSRIEKMMLGYNRFASKDGFELQELLANKGALFESKTNILYDYKKQAMSEYFFHGKNENYLKKIPLRDETIVWGVCRGMKLSQIDFLLRKLGMEPLYFGNPFEAGLAYALIRTEMECKTGEYNMRYRILIDIFCELGFDKNSVSKYFEQVN